MSTKKQKQRGWLKRAGNLLSALLWLSVSLLASVLLWLQSCFRRSRPLGAFSAQAYSQAPVLDYQPTTESKAVEPAASNKLLIDAATTHEVKGQYKSWL